MEMLLFRVWALLALIPFPGAAEEIFEVSVWPDQALVKLGQSLMVNCSTTCPDPGPSGIETFLKKTQVDKGPQWKEFLLEDVTENSVLQCFFSCAGIQKDTSLGITVYQPPEQVILELQPSWVAMGEALTVKCHVPRVVPLENLSLTLLQGNQELHRKNFMSLAVASQRAEVTIHVKAQREDDRCNFSCHAELDLSSHGGGLFHSSSDIKVLRIFGFPPPILEIEELYPLAGRDINVTCSGHVLTSPSPTLRLKGAPDTPAPGETAWLLLTTREEDNGRNFSCEASLEVQGQRLIKTTAMQLHVLYKPRLEESDCPGNQTWVKGTEQMLTCVPKGNPTPTLVCTWNGVIFNLDVPQKATQNHTGTYCCTATNQLGSVSKDIAVLVQGLDEGISSTIFIIIIVALGVGVVTIALYLNYKPCKIERRKLPYRQKEKNNEEESQFAVQRGEKCNAHNC
ncbi:intercellular adhesion molecule 5-like isoform X3 [Mustela lutreola]|uniref:Intercellular adhesion molecule 5 isoform X3 n=1 Tax=Mustela putorius furo TaxID=9669 RepID=A0A8U0TD51_MUSPF|nr:intercellular adhesion molecule 5 isoform X3 [Mustela putorius furo]XP_059005660.1 intercellular adhesion molecule 5-like isoform X3 [Mustela lutreola]